MTDDGALDLGHQRQHRLTVGPQCIDSVRLEGPAEGELLDDVDCVDVRRRFVTILSGTVVA
jgi:hypothetical protein